MLKNALYFLMLAITVTGCGKGDGLGIGAKPNVDAATRAAGTYAISRFVISGTGANDVDLTLPQTGTLNGRTVTRTGVLTVTKSTETVIAVSVSFMTTGQANVDLDLGTTEIKGTDLYSGTTKIGLADGTAFTVDETDQGVRLLISAKKN